MSPKRLTLSAKPASRQPDEWVQKGGTPDGSGATAKSTVYTARLTLDITPELRKRIKLAALAGGNTVADILRQVLEREFANVSEPRA
jgi:hypothetical protein